MDTNIKEDAHRLVDNLPDNATWDDLVNEVYTRKAIESGLSDSEKGKVKPVKEIRAKYGLE